MTNRKVIVTYLFLLYLPEICLAQHIESGKTTLRSNEDFSLSLTFPREIRKESKSLLFPEIQDFIKVKTSFEDDKVSKTFKITQTYAPLKAGSFKVNPFKVILDGKVIAFPGTKVTVLNSSSKRPTVPELEKIRFKQEKQEIYLKMTADKNSVYVGEGLTISVYLLIGDENETGFNFYDLHNQLLKISRKLVTNNCLIDESSKGIIEQLEFDTLKAGNKIYQRLKLFEEKIYPVSAHDVQFPNVEFKILKYLTAREQNNIFWKSEELKLTSASVKIKVKNLPEHPMKDQVSVGSFQFKEHISAGKVATGQSLRYTFKISGTGNISTILPPGVATDDNFDFFGPEVSEQNSPRDKIGTGMKVFTYSIVPKEPGRYALSDYFQWIYFDPTKNQYDTLKSRIPLMVSGESQKNNEISSTDLGSFYELAGKESNQLRSKEKDQSIKFFANIIILFMLVTTAILIFRR